MTDNLSNNTPKLSNSLSNDDIIKALECCKTNLIDDCKRCNLRLEDGTTQPFCTTTLIGNSLDLINRQKAEIERYKNAYEQIKWERDMFEEDLKTAKAEIKRLTKPTSASAIQTLAEQAVDSTERVPKFISKIKAEAIKEFAERLQRRCGEQEGCLWSSDIGAEMGEMVGDNDA